jgi:hypothetical protein
MWKCKTCEIQGQEHFYKSQFLKIFSENERNAIKIYRLSRAMYIERTSNMQSIRRL